MGFPANFPFNQIGEMMNWKPTWNALRTPANSCNIIWIPLCKTSNMACRIKPAQMLHNPQLEFRQIPASLQSHRSSLSTMRKFLALDWLPTLRTSSWLECGRMKADCRQASVSTKIMSEPHPPGQGQLQHCNWQYCTGGTNDHHQISDCFRSRFSLLASSCLWVKNAWWDEPCSPRCRCRWSQRSPRSSRCSFSQRSAFCTEHMTTVTCIEGLDSQ